MGQSSSGEKTKSSSPKRISDVAFSYHFYPGRLPDQSKGFDLSYSPQIEDANGHFSAVSELNGYISWDWNRLPAEICQKLDTLERTLIPLLPTYELEIESGSPLEIASTIEEITCSYQFIPSQGNPSQFGVVYSLLAPSSDRTQVDLWDSLSSSQQLVVSSLSSWVKKQAWQDLANRIAQISGQPSLESSAHKAFISYKKNSKPQQITETIASRLSQQGMDGC